MLLDENHIQDRYKSISAPATGLFKDKGSRFIAHSFPVENETEIKAVSYTHLTLPTKRIV